MIDKHTDNLKTSSNDTKTKTRVPKKSSATFKDICTKLNVQVLKEGMKSKGAVGLNIGLRLNHVEVNMTEFYIKGCRNNNYFPIVVLHIQQAL